MTLLCRYFLFSFVSVPQHKTLATSAAQINPRTTQLMIKNQFVPGFSISPNLDPSQRLGAAGVL